MKKRGISLIVLVITIIIIIILAGAVILNLADNNPIENASEAKIASDLDAFKSDLTIQIGQKYLKNTMLETEEIDSNESKDNWHLEDLVPSIKGTEYEKHLIVENGELKLRIDSALDESTKEIIEKNLGKAVLTASMIIENPKEYIGKSVTYTGYSENTNTIDWRLFGLDESGNILLKANDYVNIDYKKDTISTNNINIDGYYIYVNELENTMLIAEYLSNKDNWSEYSTNSTIARGTMTLPEFIYSYNLVNDDKISCKYFTIDSDSSECEDEVLANGYMLKKDNEKYKYTISGINEKYYINNNSNASSFCFSSQSAKDVNYLIGINYKGNMFCDDLDKPTCGVLPVVSLKMANLIQDSEGNFIVE